MRKNNTKVEKLCDMPNIGQGLEKLLIKAGILSPLHLKEKGSLAAFQLIHAADRHVCINMLYALEGAVRNIRWHKLDRNIKEELQFYYRELNDRENKK